MPIKGLTDRGAQFPRIGVLRKGAPRDVDKNRPGRDLNYFRFESQDQRATKAFQDAYGEQPATINVRLPYATVAENFPTWKEEWVAGGLVHRCDGETCVLWFDEKNRRFVSEPKPCPGKCAPVGRLTVIVPELRRFAVVVALTSSLHDILMLGGNLTAAEMLRGDLRGIPFQLRRRPRVISVPNPQRPGQRMRVEKYLLSIEPGQEWVMRQLQAAEVAALPQLPSGDVVEGEAREVAPEPESDDGWVDGNGEIYDRPPDDGRPVMPAVVATGRQQPLGDFEDLPF